MLKKNHITAIAKLLKLDNAKLEAALTSEKEEDIDISEDLQVFTKAEIETRDRNGYNTAKKAGEEMLIKEMKKKHGIELAGEDPDKFIDAYHKKVKAEVEQNPDARIAEMQKTLDTAKNALKKANENIDSLKAEKETIQLDTKLLSLFPNDRLETMTNDEYLALVKSRIKIETRDGKEVVLKDGQPVIDVKTMDAIPLADAVRGYFSERKWIKEVQQDNTPRGRGGNNSNVVPVVGKFHKLSDVRKHVDEQGLNPLGEDGQAMMQAAIKDNPGIDMNS